MRSRRIAITQRVVEATSYVERRDALAHDWYSWARDNLPEDTLHPVPNLGAEAGAWLSSLDPHAVILSNGNDCGEFDERETTERLVVDWAIRHNTPILGVCRGLQFLNLHFGGRLERDLGAIPRSVPHVAATHKLRLTRDLNLGRPSVIEGLEVNSYHNQGVLASGLAPELVSWAIAEDEVVEGLWHSDLPILAIQWHPERAGPSHGFDRQLVSRFLKEGRFWS